MSADILTEDEGTGNCPFCNQVLQPIREMQAESGLLDLFGPTPTAGPEDEDHTDIDSTPVSEDEVQIPRLLSKPPATTFRSSHTQSSRTMADGAKTKLSKESLTRPYRLPDLEAIVRYTSMTKTTLREKMQKYFSGLAGGRKDCDDERKISRWETVDWHGSQSFDPSDLESMGTPGGTKFESIAGPARLEAESKSTEMSTADEHGEGYVGSKKDQNSQLLSPH